MADFHAVGLDVKPADPSQAFNSINSILGIQSKRQDLLIQAQQLQQEQLKTQQAQGLQDFYKNFDPTKHIGSDGTTDVNSVHNSATYQNAGNAKPLIDKALGDIKQQQLGAKQSLQTLDDDTLTQLSRVAGSLANDEDVKADNEAGRQKVEDAYRSFASLGPQAARISGTFGQVTKHAQQGHLADALYSQQLMGADVLGQRGQQNPQAGTNAAGQATVADVRTGARRLAPVGGGTQEQVNPAAPTVAAATATASGGAADDVKRNEQISQSVAPSRAMITLSDQVAKLADEVRTGKFSKVVTEYAATIGQKDEKIAARQLLSKFSAQLKTQGMSNAPSDNARLQIEAGLPDPDTMSPEAIKGAAEFIKGGGLMNLSRSANARRFNTTHGNTQGLRMADDQFTTNADPLMYTYHNLPKGPARTEFIQRHFGKVEDKNDFIRRKNAVEHYGGFEQ